MLLKAMDYSGVVQNFHHFHEHTLGGRGSRAAIRFKKKSFMVNCDFEKESRNQHFQGSLRVERDGVTQKSTLCRLLIMLTIPEDL